MGKERERVNADRQRQRYSREFKLEAVRLLELGDKSAAQLALELGVRRNQLYKWQRDVRGKGEAAFPGQGAKPLAERSEVERLKSEGPKRGRAPFSARAGDGGHPRLHSAELIVNRAGR